MNSTDIMNQMRVRMSVDVPVQINAKKAHFRLRQDELAQSRTSLQDALQCIHETIIAVENGEAKFSKEYTWSKKEKEFKASKK